MVPSNFLSFLSVVNVVNKLVQAKQLLAAYSKIYLPVAPHYDWTTSMTIFPLGSRAYSHKIFD